MESMGLANSVWRDQRMYVQFISKPDRKYCRMLVGLLTGHISLQQRCQTIRVEIRFFKN